MDKLAPILKNHFWILLVPLLSMNLWGYFSANGALKAATLARQSALDSVKSGVPAGTTNPNQVYTTELKKRNDLLEKYVNEELLDLWKRQQVRMVWPPRVAADIPKKYLDDIKDNQVRFTYQTDYPNAVRQLYETVEPYVPDKRGITWTPKVDFPIALIPRMKVTNLTITSQQMWEAQEDIWVTQLILEAIRKMNKDADSETSTVIRRVIAYRLLGGDGQTSGGAEGGGEGMGEGMGEGAGAGMMMGPAGRGGMDGAGAKVDSSVLFDPVEEFGRGGELVNGGMDRGMMGAAGMEPMGMAGEGGGESGEETEPKGPLRYVNEKAESPYVERGFYLSVIINQNKLVDFLVALSNSDWPVRVVRFHFGKNPYATENPFSATRGAAGMAGMDRGMEGRGMLRPGIGPAAGGGIPMAAEPGGFDDLEGLGSAGGPQGAGPFGNREGAGALTAFPTDALQHPDLVQLDLAGLITMYRQPASVLPAEGEVPAVEGTTPDEKTAETPAEPSAAAPTEPAALPAEISPEGSSAQPATPLASELPGAEPLDATSTPESPATGDAPVEGVPGEGVPAAPADGVDPVPTDPATPAAESPPADAVPPAEAPKKP